MQEYVNQVEKPQTNRDMGVEQRLETGGSFAQGSVSGQDLKRFQDAFNRNGERSALRKLAAAFCADNGLEDLIQPDRIVGGKKAASDLAVGDERDIKEQGLVELAVNPIGVEANVIQMNPIPLPLPVHEVRQMAQKIVDALLIHEAALNKKQEITICLKDCPLDGADVSISRDGGTLRIAFSSLTSDMATLVKLNQATLREALLEKVDIKEVKISTSLREEGDANHGRSRGYAGFLASNDEDEETDPLKRRVRRHGRVARKSTAGHA
ncbi:MAG: hypothetical protein LBB26_01720 [Puniceicoccales bacterium]|jgi:hypothetical protein|nr:hypothetical protein [Puniceicoccales bacterium]